MLARRAACAAFWAGGGGDPALDLVFAVASLPLLLLLAAVPHFLAKTAVVRLDRLHSGNQFSLALNLAPVAEARRSTAPKSVAGAVTPAAQCGDNSPSPQSIASGFSNGGRGKEGKKRGG